MIRARIFALALSGTIALAASVSGSTPVSGKAVVEGKTLTLRYAWLVRGPDQFDGKSPLARHRVIGENPARRLAYYFSGY